MIAFADLVRTLPETRRGVLIADWEGRLEHEGNPDTVLILALVLGQPGRGSAGDLARARRLLSDYLADPVGSPDWKRRLAAHQLAMLGGPQPSADEVLRLLRLVGDIDRMSATTWRQRVRQLDPTQTSGDQSVDGRLELALLLGSGRPGHGQNLTRARQLLEGYLADAVDAEPALREFAAYHLRLYQRRQRQLRAAVRERTSRQALEKKLEALKAIEMRITREGGQTMVPLQ